MIKAKRKGEEVHAEPMPERDPPGDLLEALRESVEAAKKRRRKAPAARSPSSSKTRKPSKRRKREPATSRR